MTENCDMCGREYEYAERRVAAQPRPSDPTELVAVMWLCPACGIRENWPTAKRLIEHVENGTLPDAYGGKRILFVSV